MTQVNAKVKQKQYNILTEQKKKTCKAKTFPFV